MRTKHAPLGRIRQIGYVVRDVEAEMAHWADLFGIGPWFYVENVTFESFEYRGTAQKPNVSIALTNSADMQIELIQQRCNTPSSYKAFLDQGRTGQQHVAYWPDDYDAALRSMLEAGYEVDQAGEITAPGRFAYMVHPNAPDRIIEISETSGPKGKFFQYIANKAANWDGTDPIKRMGAER